MPSYGNYNYPYKNWLKQNFNIFFFCRCFCYCRLFSFLEIFYIKNSINRNVPYGFLNVTKLILTGALIVLSFVDLVIVILNNEERDVFPVDYYTPAIKIATFVSSSRIIFAIGKMFSNGRCFTCCRLLSTFLKKAKARLV